MRKTALMRTPNKTKTKSQSEARMRHAKTPTDRPLRPWVGFEVEVTLRSIGPLNNIGRLIVRSVDKRCSELRDSALQCERLIVLITRGISRCAHSFMSISYCDSCRLVNS